MAHSIAGWSIDANKKPIGYTVNAPKADPNSYWWYEVKKSFLKSGKTIVSMLLP